MANRPDRVCTVMLRPQLKVPSPSITAAEIAWNARSSISIFVRTLHLLDLHLLDDWPDITEQTLSTRSPHQSLQQRILAVEWSLFRLFEKYSPRETQDVGALGMSRLWLLIVDRNSDLSSLP